MEKYDKETSALINDTKEIKNTLKSKGWKIINQKFVEKIVDLADIGNIETNDTQEMLIEVRARKLAAQYFMDWMNDITGQVQQVEDNKKAFATRVTESVFINLEDETP